MTKEPNLCNCFCCHSTFTKSHVKKTHQASDQSSPTYYIFDILLFVSFPVERLHLKKKLYNDSMNTVTQCVDTLVEISHLVHRWSKVSLARRRIKFY